MRRYATMDAIEDARTSVPVIRISPIVATLQPDLVKLRR
jgi:hypothetical protein